MPISEKTLFYYITQLKRVNKSRDEKAVRNIGRIYKRIESHLVNFINDYYTKYSDEDGTMTVAMLQQESRYAKFMEEFNIAMLKDTGEVSRQIQQLVEITYTACYDGLLKVAQKTENIKGLSNVTPEVLKRAIENPVSGLTLPDTLEKHRKDVIYNVKQNLNIALMNGENQTTTIRKISESLDISYGKAQNIVRTETHRVQESGFADAGNEVANALADTDTVYALTWRTMKDERVRPQRRVHTLGGWKTQKSTGKANHVNMEGKTILVGEKFNLGNGIYATAPGNSGSAANDCNCRCFTEHRIMTVEEFCKITGRTLDEVKKSVDKTGKSSIMKLAKEDKFDFTKYAVKEDMKSVKKSEKYIKETLKIPNVSLKGVKNADVMQPIAENIGILQKQYQKSFKSIECIDMGDEMTIAQTVGTKLQLNTKFMNSKKALADKLAEWEKVNYIPKGCKGADYVAKHEYYHLLTQDLINEPNSRIVTAVNRALKNGCEMVSVNASSQKGWNFYHEYISDLLSADKLTNKQSKLKEKILKMV